MPLRVPFSCFICLMRRARIDLKMFLFFHAEGLASYIIPKGVQRGNEVELSDKTYDGEDEGDRLVGGLGQLVDGQKGVDNFRSDVHGFGKGKKVSRFFEMFEGSRK